MMGLALWCVLAEWVGTAVPSGGITLVVQDAGFYGLARSQRQLHEPTFETFALTVPENGMVVERHLHMWTTEREDTWVQRHQWRSISRDVDVVG